jgi:hypothetical protein
MTINELYINEVLVSLPPGFSVRINRQILNPAELNTKDAQFSYSISLPPVENVHRAFSFANIEETSNKFNRQHTAVYIVNGVVIFDGLFRLTYVGPEGYKGNLYKPAAKTVKDIFGDFALNEIPEYRIPFDDFAGSITEINEAARTGTPFAIFPFALYGVLPKVPLTLDANTYSAREFWDETVYLGMQDIPPSLNLIKTLSHLFASQGFALQGTALSDIRLNKIYMSYKNAPEYVQPWNYGYHAKIQLAGEWSSYVNERTAAASLEKGVNQSNDPKGFTVYSTDLLDAVNSEINIVEDTGGNVLYKEIEDSEGAIWARAQVRIPVSGYYKVILGASIKVDDRNNIAEQNTSTGVVHISGLSSEAQNDFANNMYEFKLLRDRGHTDFGLSNAKIDGRFYYDNLPQNTLFDEVNIPKYFPNPGDIQINMIDLAQNKNILLGFHFGKSAGGGRIDPIEFINPRDESTLDPQILAAKPALSWNAQETAERTLLAIDNPAGYWKYGRVNVFGSDEENPNVNISYAAGTRINDKALDANGNPAGTVTGNVILSRFVLERYFTYRLEVPPGTVGNIYLHNGNVELVPYTVISFDADGVAVFDTNGYPYINFAPRITLYLETAAYDIDGVLTIERIINQDSDDTIDWQITNRYRIDLDNAPASFATRGEYDGAPANIAWNGQGEASAVIWLEAGELLSVASVTAEGRRRQSSQHSTHGWVNHKIKWNLSVQPFRIEKDWLKVSLQGTGITAMDWNDPVNFDTDSINLMGFLSADIKANEFIDNVVKAFNLQLTQIGPAAFALDVKQSRTSVSSRAIELDNIASVKERVNSSLGLPSAYRLGFTIDEAEEGFVTTGDNGGGEFSTGSIEGEPIEQKSIFSYNWFKEIDKEGVILPLPIISKADVWNPAMPYPEAMAKRYTDLGYRFWYFDGLLNDLGAEFDFNGFDIGVAKVSNEIPGVSILNYKNIPKSILDNFFTILISGSSHYTEVPAFITAAQYRQLDGSIFVRFNGDLYYMAEITGYDPKNRNKSILKLIRRL